jgi:hypothetical protein
VTALSAFLRKTPGEALREDFDRPEIGLPTEFDWSVPEAELSRPLLGAIEKMSRVQRDRISNDAERVHALSDEPGQAAIYSVAENATFLDGLANPHAHSLWMFLNAQVRFRHAEEVRFTEDRRRGRMWAGGLHDRRRVCRRAGVRPDRGRRRQAAGAAFPAATSYAEVAEALDALLGEDHAYSTVVVDSVDWLEPLIRAEACRRNGWQSIESRGFRKGYSEALTIWREYIDRLNALRDRKGMAVIQIAHTDIKRFNSLGVQSRHLMDWIEDELIRF